MPVVAPSNAPETSLPVPVTIPMLDLSREFAELRDEVMQAMEQVCVRQHFVLGPPAERFEAEVEAFCQVPHALGCASGTDALWLGLAALGVGPGDLVVTSPFSFYATVSSILRTGATPVLADIEPSTFNLDPEAVERVVQRSPKARAVMPVHLYGQCGDMDALGALAQRHGLLVMEDAAQAFGASWRGQKSGSLGDAAGFSFYPTKNLSAFGDAGLVTLRDAGAADRAKALRNHGMRRRYHHDDLGGPIGWNSRLDGIQAAILSVKLRRLPAGNERRQALARRYDEQFRAAGLTGSNIREGLVLPQTDSRGEAVFHQYVIRAGRRDLLRSFLAQEGIATEIYYPVPLHLQESLAGLGYQRGDFPVAEQAATEVLALPMYPELREDEVDAVVEAIGRFYR